jgi:cob(I)alamin adenosyltransferase
LEQIIDQLDAQLPALSGFILPGGHPTAAWAHICRTVCRRAERHVTRLSDEYDEGKAAQQFQLALVYLNRLSDYLFVLARYCNHIQGVSDTLWKQK